MAAPQSVKKLFLTDCQRSRKPKDKQTEGVGVHGYASPSVCAVSQNILQSKLFRSKKLRIIGVDYVEIKKILSPIFSLVFDDLGFFGNLKLPTGLPVGSCVFFSGR